MDGWFDLGGGAVNVGDGSSEPVMSTSGDICAVCACAGSYSRLGALASVGVAGESSLCWALSLVMQSSRYRTYSMDAYTHEVSLVFRSGAQGVGSRTWRMANLCISPVHAGIIPFSTANSSFILDRLLRSIKLWAVFLAIFRPAALVAEGCFFFDAGGADG
jgi:hypothetical protein